ncbi:MAG: LysM peptidoglycan-binding domain-containing protein, partial [Bacteroidetes bacterium]|nr:LysM peptidoglycan-binding domain-containing protein [Bacteroidota bacterium]
MMIKNFFKVTILLFFTGLSAQKTHAVAQGETAYSISKKYNLSLDELYKLNPSAKEGKVNIGDILTVSKSTNSPKSVSNTDIAKSPILGTIVIQPKQTMYGITKRFKMTEDEIKKINPQLETEGLKIGSQLTLPLDKIKKYAEPQEMVLPVATKVESSTPVAISSQDEFANYTVEAGDTIFSLVNKFGTSIDELIAWNPALSQGLKSGMTIKVKHSKSSYAKNNDDALGVVLLLPFGYNVNDAKYRKLSLDFLSGAKLAIERNAKAGQQLDINIIDAGNEQTFKSSLSKINLEKTDIIIGPFFKSNVLEVLNFVKDKKIPVVSPFANSEDLYPYSNLILADTNEKVYADKINEEIAKIYSNQKIYILAGSDPGNAQYIKAQLEKKLSNSVITIVKSADDILTDKNMMTGQPAPVITVLAASTDTLANDFTNRMAQISKETVGNKAFSMYYSPVFEKQTGVLSQVSLVYLIDRKINTDGSFEKEV